jgi:hypothetical protein
MPELEPQLKALAAELEWPPTPDLASAVRPRLERRRRLPWRQLAIALAVLALGLAAAFAVPSARSAILRFLGIEGVTIERVDKLPQAAPLGTLGDRTTMAAAGRRVHFQPLLPEGLQPDAVYLDSTIPGGAVVLRYGPGRRPRLVLTEYRTGNFDVVKKYAGFSTGVHTVTVAGEPGIWIGGVRVVELGPTPPRLSAPSLIWLHRGLTLRLEARVTLDRALELARSLR